MVSSDDRVLTASVKREAKPAVQEVSVKQLARGDKFLSDSLGKDYPVAEGTYQFHVGSDEIEIKFKGGKLTDFAESINQKSKGLLKAAVVKDTKDTQVFIIETVKTGETAKLSFGKDSVKFGIGSGLISQSKASAFKADLERRNVEVWTKNISLENINIGDGKLVLKPGGEVSIPVRPVIDSTKNLVLEMDVSVRKTGADEYTIPEAPPGPSIPEGGSVSLESITIRSAPSKVDIPPWQAPKPPEVITDLSFAFLNKSARLPETEDREAFKTVRIPLSNYVSNVTSMISGTETQEET